MKAKDQSSFSINRQSTAEQAAYVATLKARHRQKRNFMKLPG